MYYQLSAEGVLHKMEAGHAGEGASNPMSAKLITLSKYELCGHCFGSKAEVGGALGKYEAPTKAPRRKRTQGVTAVE